MILPKSFYEKSTLKVAQDLLGCYLINDSPEGKTIGKIVETEAYLRDDPASHSFKGQTKRNAAMFGKAGLAYIYFIYGVYYCFNTVTQKENIGEAVLIRALEPVEGIELMKKRRKTDEVTKLCSGPAKLVIALGILPVHNFANLTDKNSPLRIEKLSEEKVRIVKTKRIGITKGAAFPHRFYIRENKFISRP